jgi:hypothetical protein
VNKREIVADIPIMRGDSVSPATLASWRGFPVAGPDRQTRIGEIVRARATGGGIQITVAVDSDVDDPIGEILGGHHPMSGWVFAYPDIPRQPGPYAAALNPWRHGIPCDQDDCDEPGVTLVRTRPDIAVYDPSAYVVRCIKHR